MTKKCTKSRKQSSRGAKRRKPTYDLNNHDVICGIDPGLTGGVSFVTARGDFVAVYDMPIVGEGSLRFVDGLVLLRMFEAHKPKLIVCEQVGAMPGQGVSSMFRFGAVYGGAMSVALAYPCPVETVVPAVWKRGEKLIGLPKDFAREHAILMYPDGAHMVKRKKDIGRADALCIVEWARCNLVRREA